MKTINISLPVDTPYMTVEGIVYHNDAGAMTPESYAQWLPNTYKNAFAHIYMDRNSILYVHPLNKRAWHTGDTWGNTNLIGIEIVQSLTASNEDFLKNEQVAFKLGAQLLKERGLPPTAIYLHKSLPQSSTSCPKRSTDLHGSDQATLNYFIEQTKKYYYGTPEQPFNQVKQISRYWVGWNVGKNFSSVQNYRLQINRDLKVDFDDIYYYKDKSNDWHIGVTNQTYSGLENYRIRLKEKYNLEYSQMEGEEFKVDSFLCGYKNITLKQLQNLRVRWMNNEKIPESQIAMIQETNGLWSLYTRDNSFRNVQHRRIMLDRLNSDLNISDKRYYELEK
ncbi:N-acetylmuramoyl-L-alanine amidase [Carnobacterium maltaromaticum]|uniref:N-acetylmuramoyl-L-alanine amidase n=1 Tax=Carnobacterium maltaromaticum TaxID=2751 RepID=UPI00298AA78C|nr:N-acetylmuramoyl-L-alanine amidase [Carnobacterium maltaromaticum]MDW5524689.1 N-acetylmuramoyl-L-alanine amidase [Carnobacterium maltaromaticum]